MKANRKFIEKEKAISAVIGIILMVAISIAIAATIYFYVSGIIKKINNEIKEGFIIDKTIRFGTWDYAYSFIISCNNSEIKRFYVNISDYYNYDIGDFYKTRS